MSLYAPYLGEMAHRRRKKKERRLRLLDKEDTRTYFHFSRLLILEAFKGLFFLASFFSSSGVDLLFMACKEEKGEGR